MSEDNGTALSAAISNYSTRGALHTFFNAVNDIEPYGPDDRRGAGVRGLNGFSGTMVFDIGIWATGSHAEAVQRAATVESVLASTQGRVLLRSTSARRNFLRVEVDERGLQNLLETSVVEVVRTPPVPFLDFREWRNLSIDDFSLSTEPSATVGVLDDAPATAHPLLSGLVQSVDSLAPKGYQWQAQGHHGTEVVGRVLYPNLADEIREMRPITALGNVRVVRILEPDPHRADSPPRFADYGFPHEIVSQGIRHLHDTYGVRVFNLSVGYAEPFDDLHVGPLTETIDDLVRELNIVVIVPTGNTGTTTDGRTDSGHHVLHDKPEYFFSPEHRLAEPGPAALAITVGSMALSGAPAEMPNRYGWQAVSVEDELSCFSRTGPGLGTAVRRMNKPDVSHYGGNLAINDSGYIVRNDPGSGMVTPSFRSGDGRLFASVIGTSFAAPAVARVAADIAHGYPDSSANLIRALLVSGAAPTAPASAIGDLHRRKGMYGSGRPSSRRSIDSEAKRTTMTYDGAMPIDTVQIHPLPLPEVFRRGSGGERTITVALAYDPPVRRQRREYLASSMKLDIYRNIDPDELAEMLIKQDPDDAKDLIRDRRRLTMTPGSNSFTNSTLQLRQWTARNSFTDDDETFSVVVTHKAQTWARSNPDYEIQTYALAVTLEDQYLVQADLHQLLTQQVRVPARVRVRS
ncbi:S8 family serine peptidase [Arthrobacter pityocampae]|uniref:S8 family serine peptidase n=1 Tax=Arthrobacter pityocampae TaxID=547334 RepID=UPI003735EDFF